MFHAMRSGGVLLAVVVLVLVLVGCGVRRTIRVTSDPPGALVHLNDQEVGRTPVAVPFTFYGTYSVRLEREGYQPLWTEAVARPPWWDYPGPDLFAAAVPGAKSRIHWHFDLKPGTPAAEEDADQLLQRARKMQQRVRD